MMLQDEDTLPRQVDTTYKVLIEKFTPTARQLITTGKDHLKALHAASSTSAAYVDVLSKLSVQSQQSPLASSNDLGTALRQMIDVYKEVEAQNLNMLKAFYMDFLVLLEANLEKDGKHLQAEQRNFQVSLKTHQDSYIKAAAVVKRRRKRKGSVSIDKDIKYYEALAHEKAGLDKFVDDSIQQVVTQERRRYGFIVERLTALSKHQLAHHCKGSALLQKHVDGWSETINNMSCLSLNDEDIYSCPESRDSSTITSSSRQRSRSLECLLDDQLNSTWKRCASQENLISSSHGDLIDKSLPFCDGKCKDQTETDRTTKAAFSFTGSSKNQLTFEEGDNILLVGNPENGWQFGENTNNNKCGWFPISYVVSEPGMNHGGVPIPYPHKPMKSHTNFDENYERQSCPSSPSPNTTVTVTPHKSDPTSKFRSSHSNLKEMEYQDFEFVMFKDEPVKCSTISTSSSAVRSIYRSLTSPELPSCFNESTDGSISCSDDSGFNNDESNLSNGNVHKSSPSEDISIWHSGDNSSMNSSQCTAIDLHQKDSSISPTFLKYLYPSDNELLSRCSSITEDYSINTSIVSDRPITSACSRKIKSQKAKKKKLNSPSNLFKSNSLLCLDMGSCKGSNDDKYCPDYEVISDCTQFIPRPPSCNPPDPPCCHMETSSKTKSKVSKLKKTLRRSLSWAPVRKLTSIDTEVDCTPPPLPPRKARIIHSEPSIFSYSEHMRRRISSPTGSCYLDQRSVTTGNICTPWDDLWVQDGSKRR